MANQRARSRGSLLCGAATAVLMMWGGAAQAQEARQVDIAPQSLASALNEFGVQTGRQVIFSPSIAASKTTRGVSASGEIEVALSRLLDGSGLTYRRDGDTFLIVQEGGSGPQGVGAGDVDALIVTAQKREENIQDVPIAMSAFTQEDLTTRQVAGGADLMTQVPNMTFTKTNFTGYSISIRGIGTQAVSATTDAAVAVAFNNTPFIRNRFFEQEFYDLERVEVLRGPQGTLYGRNATAGVVNIISAKPKFYHEAKLSADVANYNSTRLEGMLNIPLLEDKVALRIAGAWTKREGFVTNDLTGSPIDGRDLWSTRASLRFEPTDNLRASLIWEHFEEDDDRLRSGKQLCKKHTPTEIGGLPIVQDNGRDGSVASTLSQGCLPSSLYADEAFQTPNGFALPYYGPLYGIGLRVFADRDPYASVGQSRDLRRIESTRDPEYRAKSDLAQLQIEYDLSDGLTFTSETAYNADELFSTQDYNRFSMKPGAFDPVAGGPDKRPGVLSADGVFCDPQLGCSDRLVMADLSTGEARHFSQEFRLGSDFEGPFNFSVGGNFLRFDMEDKYYVFINTLTLWAAQGNWTRRPEGASTYELPGYPWVPGVSDNSECVKNYSSDDPLINQIVVGCIPIDPNPIGSLDDSGHNYFLSKNPYRLISYAAFGEAYYELTDNLKITAGARWTVDKKHAPRIPSWLIVAGTVGYPVLEVVDQKWSEPTGRLAFDWHPEVGFTDDTLLYASYARGYKAGGMNPPPAVVATYALEGGAALRESLIQPKIFEAEFVDSYEIGTKNTLLDGRLTLNANVFYYDYKDYQLSQIINRSAVTQNFDAKIWGVEIEADWRPTENLRLGFKGGYENTRVADGEQAIDLMDRTAGKEGWVTVRPFPTVPSNCILPIEVFTYSGQVEIPGAGTGQVGPCLNAYINNLDPVTRAGYVEDPPGFPGYGGFNPETAPNGGEGFSKELGGNELPNAPAFTTTLTVDYTRPIGSEWLMTLHADYYRQSEAWARIFNMDGYDKLKAYNNVNLAAIFTNEDAGWNVMAYVKNVFDTDAITGAFLNSDDTGLTTNVFLNEPRLFGLRVTKQWTGGALWGGSGGREPGQHSPFRIELEGGPAKIQANNNAILPDFLENFPSTLDAVPNQHHDLDWGDARGVKLTYQPDEGGWILSAAARYGRTNDYSDLMKEEVGSIGCFDKYGCTPETEIRTYDYVQAETRQHEDHYMVEFMVGKEVGLGALASSSTVSLGLRYASFASETHAEIRGRPDSYMAPENSAKYPQHHTQYIWSADAERSFEGAGPVLSWEASKRLFGEDAAGHADIDMSMSAGVLFGRQKAQINDEGHSVYNYSDVVYMIPTRTELPSREWSRNERATVPTFAATLGVSYGVDRVKLSTGYRWERYFDVIDGGVAEGRSLDRTTQGPYLKLSVGFGG